MDFFNRLEGKGLIYNENQKKAIMHVEGPLLVAAGPGSGKTSVIAARTAYLIQKANVSPSSILVITFTRAAANEMKDRFRCFPGTTEEHASKVEFGTFHSIFYRIVCTYYGRFLPVLEQSKASGIIKSILKAMNEPFDDDTIQSILTEISIARIAVRNPDDFKSQYFSQAKFLNILNKYERQKRVSKCIDFDDMMLICKNILEADKSCLLQYRQKYKYFLIDEFQDTCEMQFNIVKKLCYPKNNICVVGDDDQSIYGFRGTMQDCLNSFEQYYSPCTSVTLNINYRSTAEIVDLSRKIIANNSKRKLKNLKPYRGNGESPSIVFPADENSEATFVCDTVESMHKEGFPYHSFAILYRTNIQSRPFIDELVRRDIPFNIRDNLKDFFDHWVCKDLTSYLKLSQNINDIANISQVINRPVRYIPRDIINTVCSKYNQDIRSVYEIFEGSGLKEFQLVKLRELHKDLVSLKNMSPGSAVNYIRRVILYDDYIRKHCMEQGIPADELFNIIDEYEAASSGFNTIKEFLSHIYDVSKKLKDAGKTRYIPEGITLSSIHGAKGLEFPYVFVSGALEGFLPHSKCLETGENIEEERRLFYVAVTRAKDKVFICSSEKHHGKTARISRFLDEILEKPEQKSDKNILSRAFNTGELICHKIFGTGRIIKVSSETMEIQFNKRTGIKKLDIYTCINNKLIEH